MCTLALAWQVFDEAPIAVAANRDESLGRPSRPPGIYDRDPLVVAPRDVEAGGTWIGVNEYGLFAGITNRWTDADLVGERSRGLLVGDVLERSSVEGAEALLESTTATYEYEGFILVVADSADAACFTWDGELTRTTFDPGVHVVVNVGFDDTFEVPMDRRHAGEQQAANARRVRSELDVGSRDREVGSSDRDVGSIDETVVETRSDGDVTSWLERAGTVLGSHEFGVCIHGDGYGTRSSSLIAIRADGDRGTANQRETGNRLQVDASDGGVNPGGVLEDLTYEFADGPPCRTRYERQSIETFE